MELDHSKASNGFAKSICTICFQELNPIIEDIQSISICGHVFHEFCLQQLLESLPEAKKKPCPMCNQKFSLKHISRLYLQWVDDPLKASAITKSPLCGSIRDSARLSRGELVTLEEKLSFVDQALEQQQQHLRELKEELSLAKDLAGREVALKMEAVTENSIFQQMLNEKMEELEQSKAERSKLQKSILALEKELAANKLSYKELMAQCDLLAREEQNSQKKLAKAVQKKEKLKEKLKELKSALGEKDNEILRKKEKLKKKSKKLKRALEEKDKEILRSSKICKRVHMEEAHENSNKLDCMENSRSRVKKESAIGTSESCCTDLLSKHASVARVITGLPERQSASNLKTSRTEVIYVDMQGQTYFEADMGRSTNSEKGTWEQHSEKPADLVADEQATPHMNIEKIEERKPIVEQATPHMNIEKIEERKPIFKGLLGPCPQDNAGHGKSQAPSLLITIDDDVILPDQAWKRNISL
ncbi:uncharacterized protein LOC116248352 isoform X4 [Nymphaea colorata]|uniref:uncharacterized protein LOC116248352 isoform X4 n=1 Tax=Nymphaea colorata TaxID=210225 RepID=UPI00129E9DF6|nr:uncharacterized protein LOC116248352 isoform X4 [Nymphaea colorata]